MCATGEAATRFACTPHRDERTPRVLCRAARDRRSGPAAPWRYCGAHGWTSVGNISPRARRFDRPRPRRAIGRHGVTARAVRGLSKHFGATTRGNAHDDAIARATGQPERTRQRAESSGVGSTHAHGRHEARPVSIVIDRSFDRGLRDLHVSRDRTHHGALTQHGQLDDIAVILTEAALPRLVPDVLRECQATRHHELQASPVLEDHALDVYIRHVCRGTVPHQIGSQHAAWKHRGLVRIQPLQGARRCGPGLECLHVRRGQPSRVRRAARTRAGS